MSPPSPPCSTPTSTPRPSGPATAATWSGHPPTRKTGCSATALAESGATLADVLKTTVFVASAERADLVAAWDVVSAAFGEHDAPSTLLGVTVLGYENQLVEIEAVAVAPR